MNQLFASLFSVLSFFLAFCSNRNFDSKGLTDLGVGAFSKLTNLISLDVLDVFVCFFVTLPFRRDVSNSKFTTIKKGALDGLDKLVFVFVLSSPE